MLDLIAEQPERTPYLQQGSIPSPELGPREDPYDLDVSLAPIEVEQAEALELDIAVTPPPGTEVVEVEVDTVATRSRHTLDVGRRSDADCGVVLGGDGDGRAGRWASAAPSRSPSASGTPTGARPARPVRRITPYRTDQLAARADHPVRGATVRAARRRRLQQWRFVPCLPELTVEVTDAVGLTGRPASVATTATVRATASHASCGR